MKKTAVERYNDKGEPPCIVMTLRAVSEKTTPPDLSLPVTLTGVKLSQPLKLERKADIPTGDYCNSHHDTGHL